MCLSFREFGNGRTVLAGAVARGAWLAAACVALLLGGLAPAAGADAYRLGAGDQVKLVVVEEPQLSGLYTLSETGTIALPAAGPVPLAGLTLEEAAAAVRAALAGRLVEPGVALDLAQIRPFYIVGDVTNPGAYPGRTQLTLLKAIAIAGGFRRNSDTYQASITGIRASESQVVARRQLVAAQVLKARLEAQLSDAPTFAYPLEGTDAEASAIVERESQTFTLLETSLRRQLDLLAQEAAVRDDEIAALTARIAATAEQLEALRKEIDTVEALVEKGLAQSSRLFQLNREQGQLLSVNLQTTVTLNQARQARIQLELQLASLPTDRRLDLLARLQEATGTIDKLERQIAADRSVQAESAAFGFGGATDFVQTFSIQREDGSTLAEISDPATAVLPGDVIVVRRVLRRD